MQRRTLLKLGAGSAVILAVAGGVTALFHPGLQGGVLTPAGRKIFAAVGAGILDLSLPAAVTPRQTAVAAMLERVDTLVSGLAPYAQGELSQLLSVLSSTAGRRLVAGLEPDWPEASVVQIQQALQEMRLSSLALRQQAYGALHDIATSAYFSDPATWPMLGYPGPVKI